MPKTMTRSDGKEFYVVVRHFPGRRGRHGKPPHGTAVQLIDRETQAVVAEVEALCSPADNFCRATGRRLAAARLLGTLKTRVHWEGGAPHRVWGKEDRRKVFDLVCPEYGHARTAKEERRSE